MNDKVKGYKPKIKESKLRKQLLKEFEKKGKTKRSIGPVGMKHGGSVKKKTKKKKY